MKRWFWFAAFAVAWLALRIFWIDCDSGIPAVWEYGFHVTDEGYYLGGGKEMYLWGSFVDLVRQESLNYGYSAGTHWLGYLAYCVFGLSDWAWRIPFVAVYFIAWLMMFRHVARKSGEGFAFAVCLAVSSIPLVVVYERGGSNDMLIGALLMISYVLAVGKGWWRIPAAAVVMGYIITIKPSVWAFIPIVLAGILDGRKTRVWWKGAAAFVILAIAFVYAWQGVMALTVLDVAKAAGMSPWKVLMSVHANYGLPSVTDIAKDFLCVSTFPRDPSSKVLAAVSVLISVVPLALFFSNVLRRKWNGHLLLYLGVPVYVGGLTLIATQYSHYYLPMMVMLPAVFSAMQEDFADLSVEEGELKRLGIECALGLGVLGVGLLFLSSSVGDPKELVKVYSRIYNFPEANVWTMTWKLLLFCVLAGVAVLAIRRGLGGAKREGWAWAIVLFGVASVAFAAYPGFLLAPRLRVASGEFFAPMTVGLAAGLLFAYVLFACPRAFARKGVVLAVPVGTILACYLAVPTWRSAAVELVRPGTHIQDEVAKEVGKLVPHDAILLGERSSQVCMSLPIRTATTFLANSNPIPVIEAIRKREPDVKLYALADTQHAYMLKHFMEDKDKVRLELVKTFKMPSFATGKPADVHLCRINVLKETHK